LRHIVIIVIRAPARGFLFRNQVGCICTEIFEVFHVLTTGAAHRASAAPATAPGSGFDS
jgi:hypothetical protein